jgi:hypothetical protein
MLILRATFFPAEAPVLINMHYLFLIKIVKMQAVFLGVFFSLQFVLGYPIGSWSAA